MKHTADKMLAYMRGVVDGTVDTVDTADTALDINEIPEDFRELAAELKTFGGCVVETRQKHKDALEQMQAHNASIEQFNLLISELIHYIPQQIIVVEKEHLGILLMNEAAIMEMHINHEYIETITSLMEEHLVEAGGTEVEIVYNYEGVRRYLRVRAYEVQWDGQTAVIYAISDISDSKNEIEELEIHAYRDSLTNLYNRAFGMKTLEEWIENKKRFVLVFADLDRLKYINDEFGHNEGDMYIINAAKHLLSFPEDAVVCRLGGDEYMVLVPDTGNAEVEAKTVAIYDNLSNDEYLSGKEYSYSISFGFVTVDTDNTLPSSVILNLADERMYESKKARKKARLQENL
ncbi:MAG: GGDEF domain-containing protein [Oscillospiraceae bacterium]|nr:GGDEF domain-containing protein [Oscillospiraceae bacterium]